MPSVDVGTTTIGRDGTEVSRPRRQVRRFRTLGVAAGLSSMAMLVAAPTALAVTKLGQTKQNYTCSPQYQCIQTAAQGVSYAAPATGKLTRWSTLAGTTPGTMQFEVWRPA